MKILLAASEAVPFCKTGGLGDVVGSLLSALRGLRHDARLVLPKHRAINEKRFGLRRLPYRLTLPLGDGDETAALWEARLHRTAPVYFVDAPKYFDRAGLYVDETGRDFADNDDRFILFSRAVLETAKAVDFRPDVLHAHDWQTGLAPAYLSTVYRHDAFFIPTAACFTVHNMAYQGLFPKDALFRAGFS
ncbi:MAG TPA: glycogen/starch synthase, partial [Elusimicrobiota bacterium]|nr:glycogen/starch synthase [Elusimicrobiota bacterium]